MNDVTKSTSKPKTGWLKITLFNLAFFLIGAEVLAVGLYAWRTGSLYYADPPSGRSVPLDVANVEGFRIHPYFGFQLRAHSGDWNGTFANNNHGFVSTWDFPRERRDGEVLIGVFGGSVASYLAQYERDHGVIAATVAEALDKSPDDVVVMNFAQGGFKQPQQVQILSYFLATGQEFDAVVNIDGFNEVALGARNQLAGIGPAQPSVEHVLGLQAVTPLVSSKRRAKMEKARHAYDRYAEIYNRAWSGEAPETKLAVGFLWHYLRYKYYNRQVVLLRQQFSVGDDANGQDPSWLYLQPSPGTADPGGSGRMAEGGTHPDDVEWPPILGVWQRSAVAFAEIARAAGAVSVHVLQPNQYFPTERRFSDAEKAVAVSDHSPYAALIPPGYDRLATEAKELTAAGVPVHNLYRLLDDLEAQAYVDDCCHYTDAGNDLLARELGQLLRQAFAERRDAAANS